MKYHLVANKETIKRRVGNDVRMKRFGEDGRWERRLPREWWKKLILPQYNERRTNVVFFNDSLNLYEALRSKDASK